MSDLLKRFENLTINSSDDGRNVLQDYVCKVKSEKKYFDCQNNFLVIPEQVGSKFVLCERKYIEGLKHLLFNVWVKFSRDNVCHIQLLSLRN